MGIAEQLSTSLALLCYYGPMGGHHIVQVACLAMHRHLLVYFLACLMVVYHLSAGEL